MTKGGIITVNNPLRSELNYGRLCYSSIIKPVSGAELEMVGATCQSEPIDAKTSSASERY